MILGIRFNDSSIIDLEKIYQIDRFGLKTLIEYCSYQATIIQKFDLDHFYKNVWIMEQSFQNIEYFETIPVSKYIKLVEIRNKEVVKMNRDKDVNRR